jgi:hypothetical protein
MEIRQRGDVLQQEVQEFYWCAKRVTLLNVFSASVVHPEDAKSQEVRKGSQGQEGV